MNLPYMISTMKWFGSPWGAPLNVDCPRAAVPTDATCLWCEEKIELPDSGIIYSNGPAAHLECFLRQTYGSVGHQLGICACDNGPDWMNDPPGLSRRDAAKAAVTWFEAHHK